MKKIPYGTRYLIITCANSKDKQFRGIYDVSKLLNKRKGIYHHKWEGNSLFLSRRRVLKWVVISGHGAKNYARLSDGHKNRLYPKNLSLARDIDLFLLGCYQGKEKIKKKWAQETGLFFNNVHGSKDDTESALSTLFLLNVFEHGPDKAGLWFNRWIKANNYFSIWLTEIRRLYKANNLDFLVTLDKISHKVNLKPFDDFLLVGKKYPLHISQLG